MKRMKKRTSYKAAVKSGWGQQDESKQEPEGNESFVSTQEESNFDSNEDGLFKGAIIVYQEDIQMLSGSGTFPKPISHSAPLTSSTHSHHIDVFNPFDSKESTKQKNKKNESIFIISKGPNTKVTTFIMWNVQTTTKQMNVIDSNKYEWSIHENQLLEEAVCNAIQSMHKDISIYIEKEEKEKQKEIILSNKNKYFNISKSLRPIT
jgi:hypothetical protein